MKKKTKEEEKGEGIAKEVLKGIADLIPGLGEVIKKAAKTEPFKSRLKEVDEEVKRKIQREIERKKSK